MQREQIMADKAVTGDQKDAARRGATTPPQGAAKATATTTPGPEMLPCSQRCGTTVSATGPVFNHATLLVRYMQEHAPICMKCAFAGLARAGTAA